MVGPMMWFKREPKAASEKPVENGVVGKLRRKKALVLKPTRESSERETSTESEKEKRRHSDILDIKVSQERRDESDESLYESADCHSDAISASDDALPRLSKTPTMSKESLKLAITDEEVDLSKTKKTHRKTMSLSNPLEIVKNLGDEWFDHKKELEKHSDKKKSRESLWSEEDRESIHGSTTIIEENIKNDKKEDSQSNSRKSSTTESTKSRKSSKASSVSALNFLRRKKTPTSTVKPVEVIAKVEDKVIDPEELLRHTKLFLEEEKRYSSVDECKPVDTDSDEEILSPKPVGDHRRRFSRQTSRSKSKVRGKSQTVKVNTLRKSHSGTLKKGKKKSIKTPLAGRSRQASVVEQTPILKKKSSDSLKQNYWLFSGSRGEPRREGSTDEPTPPEPEPDQSETKDTPDKDNNWRGPASVGGRGVNRAESCRERDAPRRGKHRNASDPNRLTAHHNHDLEPGSVTAPSGSSSSSSLSSKSNESNTAAAEQQASQSDWSEEEEPLAAQWADSLPPQALDSLLLSPRLRKRQEVIHELIVSEGSHVRWLRVLGQVFLRPLERAPGLLAADEVRGLFPGLPAVRERHARLYADLRAARAHADMHLVQIRPVADAMLYTLGDSGYAGCLSRFCRGQRMALDALKERRRKNKELHHFLSTREQLPLCGRLQLRDLLACVWQRLTKYQLLLESILKTVSEDGDDGEHMDSEEDMSRLRRAHDVAREVLQHVDTAIRTAENEHRLRSIQSKLEVRLPSGVEWEDARRAGGELAGRDLRLEGDLQLRADSKRCTVRALLLEESLVLLQREGDKFVLKPVPQPSQPAPLSPVIKWDKVLFRPNAAVKNTFFLMNINGVQMHELSAPSPQEYATWVKHIQELPLAKPELRPALVPTHHSNRSTDDSGINVSRNPSDASEKSSSTAAADDAEVEPERASAERERDDKSCERDNKSSERDDRDERRSIDLHDDRDTEDKHKARRPTVGRISTHPPAPPADAALVDARTLTVRSTPPAHTARTALSHHERLRRLDAGISRALRAKSLLVGELLGVPREEFLLLADMATADTMGLVERAPWTPLSDDVDELEADEPDIHQLLLAAHAQATQLTEQLSRALTVGEGARVAARAHCDRCLPILNRQQTAAPPDGPESAAGVEADLSVAELESLAPAADGQLEDERQLLEAREWSADGAALAARLSVPAGGVRAALGALAAALPGTMRARVRRRQGGAADRERADWAAARGCLVTDDIYTGEDMDPTIQEQPSNGG